MIVFTKEQIIKLHEQLISKTGGENGIRDISLLESAIMTPFQSFDDTDLYPSIQSKAARLGYGLIKNHPFVDGNKRIGTHIMLLFLYFNGVELRYTQRNLADFILKLASGIKNCDDLLNWINEHRL